MAVCAADEAVSMAVWAALETAPVTEWIMFDPVAKAEDTKLDALCWACCKMGFAGGV